MLALCARIQTLLRGHKYRVSFFFEGWLWLDGEIKTEAEGT